MGTFHVIRIQKWHFVGQAMGRSEKALPVAAWVSVSVSLLCLVKVAAFVLIAIIAALVSSEQLVEVIRYSRNISTDLSDCFGLGSSFTHRLRLCFGRDVLTMAASRPRFLLPV